MSALIITPLVLSIILYLIIGFSNYKHIKSLADLLPIKKGANARVASTDEFSSSTVAATISLATVILAYFELAGYFGTWLLWTALTTAIGIWVVSVLSKRIWTKLSLHEHKPSMHGYLGIEYNSKTLEIVGAICTCIGFLLVYATELVVGSQFIAKLIPEIPEIITIVVLSSTGFIYTATGGFRAVVKTDQIQMKFIWVFIFFMLGYYFVFVLNNNAPASLFSKIPVTMYNFDIRPGLISFLIGIAVMNIPLFISNMAIWQRIAGANDANIVKVGLRSSVLGSLISWSLLTVIACLGYLIVTPKSGTSYFPELMSNLNNSLLGKAVLFFTVLGLFGAMLSSASTNLIVLTHTLYEDIYIKVSHGNLTENTYSRKALTVARGILILAGLFAVALVLGLKYLNFSIADLAFSIYGGGLALSPAIIASLFLNRQVLNNIKKTAILAIIIGFAGGWLCAIYGKIAAIPNLVFLSPCVSFGSSATIILLTIVWYKYALKNSKTSQNSNV